MFDKSKNKRIEQLKLLYPNENVQIELKKRKKTYKKQVFAILLVGILFIFGMQVREKRENQNLNEILRGEHQTSGEQVDLLMEVEGMGPYEITIEVESLRYTFHEVEHLYQELITQLKDFMLAENESLTYITKDLNLVEKIEPYPFEIYWTSSDLNLISQKGELLIGNIEEGSSAILTAKIKYGEFEKEVSYILDLYVLEEQREELFIDQIKKLIIEKEYSSRESEKLILPNIANGKEIIWKKKENSYFLEIIAFCILLIVLVAMKQKSKIQSELKEREKEMNQIYPELISKLTLLLCAGFTLRNAWEKMAEDYQKREEKRFAYEQMLQTKQKMEKGFPEGLAYENFGNICKQDQYRKLGILLSQNLKRGNNNIVERMKEESRQAYKVRRDRAREAGEKAQTKILIPMMLLLILVLIVIVMPVFVTM